MQHELKQVEVRLKLTDKTGVFSMERIDTCLLYTSDAADD